MPVEGGGNARGECGVCLVLQSIPLIPTAPSVSVQGFLDGAGCAQP